MRIRSSAGGLSIFETGERDAVERIVSAIQEALYLRAREAAYRSGGTLFNTSQYRPSFWAASRNSLKSTGLRTYELAPS